jgi:hypothetical protein
VLKLLLMCTHALPPPTHTHTPSARVEEEVDEEEEDGDDDDDDDDDKGGGVKQEGEATPRLEESFSARTGDAELREGDEQEAGGGQFRRRKKESRLGGGQGATAPPALQGFEKGEGGGSRSEEEGGGEEERRHAVWIEHVNKGASAGKQGNRFLPFSCFTSTKVQTLTPEARSGVPQTGRAWRICM